MEKYITFNMEMFTYVIFGCYNSFVKSDEIEKVKDDVVELFNLYQEGLREEHIMKLNDLPQ